jgi:hypothetical protein
MPEKTRWEAITISLPISEDGPECNLNCRIDLLDSGKAHGVMIWRDNGMGKGHHIDKAFDKISRKLSRIIQGRKP